MNVIPKEFDIIRTGRGYTMKGWDFTVAEIKEALEKDRMLNPTFELTSNFCPWNCFFCFTEDSNNPEGLKKKLTGEMPIGKRLELVEQAKALGARSINIVGAGEPTLDVHFMKIVERIAELGMIPIIYTEGALRLTDMEFAGRLHQLGATIVLKVNSLWNEEYQNAVVNSGERSRKPLSINYFRERNRAIEVLMETGFSREEPTRLAFDTVMCEENYDEISRLHRYTRENNVFLMLVDYLPAGRSSTLVQNAVPREKQLLLLDELAGIDRKEYGIEHSIVFPYAGGVPCSIRGLGLHVKIKGDAYDCPAEMERLGSIHEHSLKELWEKARHIRKKFNGRCLPKEKFWSKRERLKR